MSAVTMSCDVTIIQEANERALPMASICRAGVSSVQPPPRSSFAQKLRAARVVDRPVLRPAARIAVR